MELELLVVTQVNDLKLRLSLDSQKNEVDWGTLGVFYKENSAKLREGLEFYGEGFNMLSTDIQVIICMYAHCVYLSYLFMYLYMYIYINVYKLIYFVHLLFVPSVLPVLFI